MRKGALALVGAAVLMLVDSTPAEAHGIGGRLDLPVPVSYFIIGAGLALVISFVALSVLWTQPRLQSGVAERQTGLRVPQGGVVAVLGVIGLLLVIGQLVAPVLGVERDPTRPTIAPVLVWVVFWLVVPFLGALVGDLYTDLNPWRAIAGATGIGSEERTGVQGRLGIWPAAVALLAFTWLELVSPNSSSPTVLGLAALGYTVFLVVTMAAFGRETGLAVFDAFTPYNRLLSSISPLGRRPNGRIVWRGWLRALPVIPEWRGLAAFVAVAIGTVSFDGASNTAWFKSGFGDFGASRLGGTVLLVLSVLVIGAGYLLASWAAARMVGGDWTATGVASRFAHTLVPIALAYAVAHYLTLIIFEGQQLIAAVSDPFGIGWDLLGTADRKVDFFVTTSEPIWYAQVAVIIAGHVTGVILAHDRALADFGRDAVRSQYAMLLLMVALTTLGLVILAG